MTNVAATETHLTTGWEQGAPPGDSLVRRYLFHSAAACEAFATAASGRSLRTPAFLAADLGVPSGYFNAAVLVQPPAPSGIGALLDEIGDFFADGHGEAMLWSPWPLPEASLARRGWHLGGHPPLLVRPPASLVPPPGAPDIDIRPVADPAGLAAWEQVVVEGYPLPELQPFRAGRLAHPRILDDARMRMWVGYDGAGIAASAGTLFVEDDIASLTLGVTRPEARSAGHWRRQAVERLLAAPDVWVTGVFSDMSRGPAEGLGFVPVIRLALWILQRPEQGALQP
jgi:hypothetical protein